MDYRKIPEKIADRWPVKVLCVVAAIFLFAFHRLSEFHERNFSVPLRLDIASNLVPGSAYPQFVRISMRGTNSIYNISETDIEAVLNLSKYTEPGIYKAQILIQRKGNAADAEIPEIYAEPSELSVELDLRMSKSVPLLPNIHGFPEQGYEMVSYTLEPNQVMIDGPAKLLLSVTGLNTDIIDMQGRNADFSADVRIINPNQLINIRGETSALFNGFIKEYLVIKNLENIPVRIRGLNELYEAVLHPPVVSARINGVQSMLDGITAEMILLSVYCGAIDQIGIYELTVQPETDKKITIERIEPETVKADIRRKEEQAE